MDAKISDDVTLEDSEMDTKDDLVLSPENGDNKKHTKNDKGSNKSDKKIAERYLKSLHNVHTTEEKLEAICQKYSEIFNENRKLQMTVKQAEKKICNLLQEREQYQGERTKAISTRKKLESLCRELQKQNKAIKEESLLKIREEEEKRKEVSSKLQRTLDEVKATMNNNIEISTKLCEENAILTARYNRVYAYVEHQAQQLKILEVVSQQASDIKDTFITERILFLQERTDLLCQLVSYEKEINHLKTTEVELRKQINLYKDKYDEFQNTHDGSNKVDGEFNEEIEKMSKKILALEKEITLWKQKYNISCSKQLEMCFEKQKKDVTVVNLTMNVSLLQDMCKMFQRERASLLARLEEKDKKCEYKMIKQEDMKASEITLLDALNTTLQNVDSNGLQLQLDIEKPEELVNKTIEMMKKIGAYASNEITSDRTQCSVISNSDKTKPLGDDNSKNSSNTKGQNENAEVLTPCNRLEALDGTVEEVLATDVSQKNSEDNINIDSDDRLSVSGPDKTSTTKQSIDNLLDANLSGEKRTSNEKSKEAKLEKK